MRVADAARAALTTFILTLAPAWPLSAQEPEPPPEPAPPPEPDPTPTSFYVLLGGGASLPSDTDISGGGVATAVDAKWGTGALAAFGVDFGDNVRTELEFAYRRAGIDSVGGGATGGGDIGALSAMGNVVFDFSNRSPFTPYAGLGLGVARIDYDGVSPVGGSRIDDADTVFALQGIAGFSVALSPAISLFTDYRYMAAGDPALMTDAGAKTKGAFTEHRITLGLRWSFGGPGPRRKRGPEPVSVRPAPMPSPAMAPARPLPDPPPPPDIAPPKPMPKAKSEPAARPAPTFERVFFDWNRSDITPEAQAKIDNLVTNLKPQTVIRIDATGHADRSGTLRNNLIISRRRAEAVKKELMRQGVLEEWITIAWKGETEPLIETPDGQRQPENRRVDIVITGKGVDSENAPSSRERISRK
jgi:outer membrane protein OmpA-like peptidoglycan-associated protein/opacity protein-like surface antigen